MEEQLVGILEAVKEATPEVAAQAVAYGRWCNVCWLVSAIIGSWFAARACNFCHTHWDEKDYVGHAILAGVVLAICLLISVCSIGNLIGSYIAPDYFAADAVIRLFRLGVH